MNVTIRCAIAGVLAAVVQAAFAAEPPLADVESQPRVPESLRQ